MTDFSVTPQSTPVAAQDALHTPGAGRYSLENEGS